MEILRNILDFIGYVEIIVIFIVACIGVYQWIKGIWPALWRLGNGLASREIAIIADSDNYASLKNTLIDSSLFKERNITQITTRELTKVADCTLLLAHWNSISSNLDLVLSNKKDVAALLIYAPQEEGLIPREAISKINQHRNVIVVNFRGRLLNDIIVSLITTSYEK